MELIEKFSAKMIQKLSHYFGYDFVLTEKESKRRVNRAKSGRDWVRNARTCLALDEPNMQMRRMLYKTRDCVPINKCWLDYNERYMRDIN